MGKNRLRRTQHQLGWWRPRVEGRDVFGKLENKEAEKTVVRKEKGKLRGQIRSVDIILPLYSYGALHVPCPP